VRRSRKQAEKLVAHLQRVCQRSKITLQGFGRQVIVYDREGAEVFSFERIDMVAGVLDLEFGMKYGGPNPITGHPDLIGCSHCGFEFDAGLGNYGCPNCHGEGLKK
jgi:hypothetical protein